MYEKEQNYLKMSEWLKPGNYRLFFFDREFTAQDNDSYRRGTFQRLNF